MNICLDKFYNGIPESILSQTMRDESIEYSTVDSLGNSRNTLPNLLTNLMRCRVVVRVSSAHRLYHANDFQS